MRKHIPYTLLILFGALLLLGSCGQQDQPLQLSDLTAGEHLYFERVIAMERARTVAMIHRDTGEALLDSLGAAWGDSIPAEIQIDLTRDPYRAKAVAELLLKILTAEQDSLKWDPGVSRLHLPLPDPERPGRERVTNPDNKADGAVPRT